MLCSVARILALSFALAALPAFLAYAKPIKQDYHIDGADPGVRLFVRQKMAEGSMASDPTSQSRTPPSLRAPNGVLEDTFMQATGRRIWSASSIYVPTLVIAGEHDTWSYPEDREGLIRDLTNAPAKKSVLIKDATHFVLFEKPRFKFFNEILKFLKD